MMRTLILLLCFFLGVASPVSIANALQPQTYAPGTYGGTMQVDRQRCKECHTKRARSSTVEKPDAPADHGRGRRTDQFGTQPPAPQGTGGGPLPPP